MIVSYKSDEAILWSIIGILMISLVSFIFSIFFYVRCVWGEKKQVSPVREKDAFYDSATGVRLYPSAKDCVLSWPIYNILVSSDEFLDLRIAARNGVAVDVIVVGKVGVVKIGRPAMIPLLYVCISLLLFVWQYSSMR